MQFDSHADFLLDVLIHTSKDSPPFQRGADDLIKYCESLVSSLTFQQLFDYIKYKGASEEKTTEIMDIFEPALGDKIASLLSGSSYRPKTIVRMMHKLLAVGESKHGREFTLELRRQLLDALTCESGALANVDNEDDRLSDGGNENMPHVLAIAGKQIAGALSDASSSTTSSSPEQPDSPRPTRHSTQPRQKYTLPYKRESSQVYVPHSALPPSKTVHVRMQRRSDMSRQHQECVIFLACMAKLGVRCGAWSCQSIRQGFVLIFGTSNEAQHAVGRSLIVDGDDVCLDASISLRGLWPI